MAIVGNGGRNISFECSELICMLKNDITEFGKDLIVEVVTQDIQGAKIYKDYNFIADDPATSFKLEPGETLEKITAGELLKIYKKQNSIL